MLHGIGPRAKKMPSQSTINRYGKKYFNEWGGIDRVNALYPKKK